MTCKTTSSRSPRTRPTRLVGATPCPVDWHEQRLTLSGDLHPLECSSQLRDVPLARWREPPRNPRTRAEWRDVPADIPPAGEPPEPVPAPDVRASDADRDRVIDVLRAATADGRLTADEFSERMEAALSSRTFRELAPLTADLVTTPASRAPESAQAKDVIRIDQRGGSVQRTGRWLVPQRLEMHPSWCDVTIDFTDAVIRHDTLHDRHEDAWRVPDPGGRAGHRRGC